MDAVIPMFIQVKQPGEIFQREAFLQRKRTPSWATALGVALYAQGLSLRRTALLLTQLGIHVTHVAVWYWLQRFAVNCAPWAASLPDRVLVDETQVKLGGRRCWIWAALHPQTREVLYLRVSRDRSLASAVAFFRELADVYGQRPRGAITERRALIPRGAVRARADPARLDHAQGKLRRALVPGIQAPREGL